MKLLVFVPFKPFIPRLKFACKSVAYPNSVLEY